MNVTEFDAGTARDAEAALAGICDSPQWAAAVVASRPHHTLGRLLEVSDAAVTALSEPEFAAALSAHPRIGDRTAGGRSQREQAGVAASDADTLAALATLGAEYERRHGMVYLVHASGRSGTELLDLLRGRLDNDVETERHTARAELATITRHRLRQTFAPAATSEGAESS